MPASFSERQPTSPSPSPPKRKSSESSGIMAEHINDVGPRPDEDKDDEVVNEEIELQEVNSNPTTIQDPIYGEIGENSTNFRSNGWLRTSILMMKTQIGIGALSVPQAFDKLGLIPGVIALTAFGIITTWSNWEIGQFRARHTAVYGLGDAGKLMFGRIGKEIFYFAFQLYYIFVGGSAMVSVATALNALTDHGTCTAVFIGVAAIAAFLLSSIRKLSKVSYLAWAGLVCILVSIFALAIAVGVQDRPAAATQTGPWSSDYKLIGNPTFAEAMSAISTIIFAFSGTAAFLPIAAEMREPRHYNKAMFLCQSVVYMIYLVIGVVVYYFCGSYVTSPALGSAGTLMKKVCYGIALFGLLVTMLIVCHLPAKNFFIRILRGSRHLSSNSRKHWLTWFSCTSVVAISGYVVASAIPAFSGLVSFIGALLGTPICIQAYGMMWLYDNWESRKSPSRGKWWSFGVFWSVFIIIVGFFCMAAGTYGSVVDIVALQKKNKAGPWSCADNSGSS